MDAEQAMAKALEGQFWGWSDNGYEGRVRNLNTKPLPKKKSPVEQLPEIASINGLITCDAIVRAVCVASGVSMNNMLSQRRFPRYVIARQAAMALAYEMTSLSTPQIGRAIGDRDHSTVIHAIRSVETNFQRYESVITATRKLLDDSGLRLAA
jgi:hypothetical protein